MQQSLRNKTAIITGASRGIGKAIALKLSKIGASVVINYATNAQAADGVASTIINDGGQAVAIRGDVRRVDSIESLFETTIEKYGKIDIVVNNAGTILYKNIADITEQEYDNIFDCNVKGLFFCCQQAARKMADGGKIINISSTVTKVMMPLYGAYAATKGAVEQITKVLAKELGPRGIAVNTISPGPVDTELFRQGKSEKQIQLLARMAAFGRIGTPEDIADVVAFLATEEANWISGQNICVNGGFIA
jgi:3-oxoacyl-[acyl-carrier protein] reductase